MLHYVDQLVAICVSLLHAAEQVVYSGCLELFHCTELPAVAESDAMRAVRGNHNRKVVGRTAER